MHKELHSIRIIRDYMAKKNLLPQNVNNIESIYSFFQYLSSEDSKKKFNSLYIMNYIYMYIASDEVAKRKTSSRVFEDLLAIIFDGEVTDSKRRKNIKSDVPECFELVQDKLAGNKREKIDLLFNDEYGVSVKTLMMSNKEINMGSFEKKILFDGFNVTKYLTERKTDSDMGLGSKPRLKKLLELLKENGHYDKFQDRFEKMFSFIFSDDIILAIKENEKMYLYFFSGEEFTTLFTSKIADIDELLKILNRWEGNSIRIDRSMLLENANRMVELDFSILDKTVISLVNQLDYKLHETYIQYFNEESNHHLKFNLIESIDELFNEFQIHIEALK
jgi:hypothetical protein